MFQISMLIGLFSIMSAAKADPCMNNFCGSALVLQATVPATRFAAFVEKAEQFEVIGADGVKKSCKSMIRLQAEAPKASPSLFGSTTWVRVSKDFLPINLDTGLASFFVMGERSGESSRCIFAIERLADDHVKLTELPRD